VPIEPKLIAAPVIMVRKHRHIDRSAAMAMS
jgi:hypothetical protein